MEEDSHWQARRLRVGELFDIVVEWPESLGGIEDLNVWEQLPEGVYEFALILISPTSCLPNPHAPGYKLHVALSTRLLRPVAATR